MHSIFSNRQFYFCPLAIDGTVCLLIMACVLEVLIERVDGSELAICTESSHRTGIGLYIYEPFSTR